jgi:hypothetical protein
MSQGKNGKRKMNKYVDYGTITKILMDEVKRLK